MKNLGLLIVSFAVAILANTALAGSFFELVVIGVATIGFICIIVAGLNKIIKFVRK